MFRTVTVKINDISQQLPYIVVNQADDNGKIIRFVPMDHGQKVTGFTGARLYYPPRSDDQYGDYVTGVEADGAWDFTIPVGALSVGRVGCNLSFIDGNGETYSRNVVFLVEPAVSGVFDPEDGQQTRIDKIIGTVQDTADTAIGSINKTASDAVDSIGKAETSINESVTVARGSADAAANSEQQAAASASAAQTSERNASNSAMQASQSATAAKQSETNAAESERNAASSAEQAANVVASVSGSVSQAENAARSASQSATAAAGSASAAGGNAQAAAQSASDASASASAAKASETNAASSASAAKTSETNAADSSAAAQNAVDGFGLEVGTTTTGDPGTDAAVEIEKTGTKYTANFTIPRGNKGEQGSTEHDDTLTGDGTSGNPLAIAANQVFSTADKAITDANNMIAPGCYSVDGNSTNVPYIDMRGQIIVPKSATGNTIPQVMFSSFGNKTGIFFRAQQNNTWGKWEQVSYKSDVPSLLRTMAAPESKGWNAIDFNDFTENGVYTFNGNSTNSPRNDHAWITGTLIVAHSIQRIMQLCAYFPRHPNLSGFAFRDGAYSNEPNINWTKWHQIAFVDELPQTPPLANETGDIASLSTRVQALEARIKSLETNQ